MRRRLPRERARDWVIPRVHCLGSSRGSDAEVVVLVVEVGPSRRSSISTISR